MKDPQDTLRDHQETPIECHSWRYMELLSLCKRIDLGLDRDQISFAARRSWRIWWTSQTT